jgi:RNA 2',3'-cyclic 3'-phosphodiesterase
MRLFVALDIDELIRQKIAGFVAGLQVLAPEVRWVRPDSLHITLKFIGELEAAKLPDLQQALAMARSPDIQLNVHGYGFFPTARSARVFWVGIDSDPDISALARTVDRACAQLAIPPEQHDFSPHLTLARGKSGAPARRPGDRPNQKFVRLQNRLASMPEPQFGTMTAREFFLYESKLSASGACYTKLNRFALSG